MDIDDILREADPNFDSVNQGAQDLQALTRAWVAERSSPEILECAALPQQFSKAERLTAPSSWTLYSADVPTQVASGWPH
jgi:hypothetical protein